MAYSAADSGVCSFVGGCGTSINTDADVAGRVAWADLEDSAASESELVETKLPQSSAGRRKAWRLSNRRLSSCRRTSCESSVPLATTTFRAEDTVGSELEQVAVDPVGNLSPAPVLDTGCGPLTSSSTQSFRAAQVCIRASCLSQKQSTSSETIPLQSSAVLASTLQSSAVLAAPTPFRSTRRGWMTTQMGSTHTPLLPSPSGRSTGGWRRGRQDGNMERATPRPGPSMCEDLGHAANAKTSWSRTCLSRGTLESHNAGLCKPCLFVRTGVGCKSGLACQFCHLVHSRESRPCKAKRDRYKKLLARYAQSDGNGGR